MVCPRLLFFVIGFLVALLQDLDGFTDRTGRAMRRGVRGDVGGEVESHQSITILRVSTTPMLLSIRFTLFILLFLYTEKR